MNREKFIAELAALAQSVAIKGLCPDGPQAGRAVLADGTIIPAGWDGVAPLVREDGAPGNTAAALRYRNALLAHDQADTPAQRNRRRGQLRDVAFAAVLKELQGGPAAPAWAQAVVDQLAGRVGEGD